MHRISGVFQKTKRIHETPPCSVFSGYLGLRRRGERAVYLHEFAGVRLNQKPLVNCKTARALDDWVRRGAKPAISNFGERLESLRVVAHYTCRIRNNQPGGKVSEHGKGNAIDIAGFRLGNGTEISVLNDWGVGGKGKALSKMRRAACGRVGVVLGPGSDGFHEDHSHFDTSSLDQPYRK